MTRRAAALAVTSILLTSCSDSADLPDSSTLHGCLTEAGVDPDSLDTADDRREAFAEPDALDCVANLSPQEQEDTLSGVFTTDGLADALVGWIGWSDATPEVEARAVGSLAGAAGDPDDSDVDGGALDELLAVAIRHQDQPTSFYEEWLEDPEAQRSVPDGYPLSGPSLYLDWLEDHGSDSEEYAEAQEVRELQEGVATAREDAAEAD